MTDVDRYRRGSLGDLMQLVIDGWEITHLHYGDVCGDPGMEIESPAAFVILRRPDSGLRGIYIPEDERALSHRGLIDLFRQSPRIWKHRTAEAVRQRMKELIEAETSRESEAWGHVLDPADLPMDVQPTELVDVIGLGQVETIEGVTVAVLSIERYRSFSRVRYLAHTVGHLRGGSLAALDVLVVDNRGRRYRSASVGVERAGSRLEGVIALTPGIPRDVTALTVTIGTLGASGPDGHLGPWVFPVVLPTPGLG